MLSSFKRFRRPGAPFRLICALFLSTATSYIGCARYEVIGCAREYHPNPLAGSPTFLLPQWGGIYIFNQSGRSSTRSPLSSVDLAPVFSAFANQLSALLGVPSLPSGIASEGLTDWQLDAVLRSRASENMVGTQQTLSSIVKLVDQIENMPVDEHVRGDVQDALKALDQVRSVFFFSYSVPILFMKTHFFIVIHRLIDPRKVPL